MDGYCVGYSSSIEFSETVHTSVDCKRMCSPERFFRKQRFRELTINHQRLIAQSSLYFSGCRYRFGTFFQGVSRFYFVQLNNTSRHMMKESDQSPHREKTILSCTPTCLVVLVGESLRHRFYSEDLIARGLD